MSRPRRTASLALLLAGFVQLASGHDIPNARVDRSIQLDLSTEGLAIEYEVSVSELTLTQDLRTLVGQLPGADRRTWFAKYGEITGPLNAKGFLVRVDDKVLDLKVDGFRLVIEDHPRFFFRFTTPLPRSGRLLVRDTNYAASEGTSRLALRAAGGIKVESDDLPADVSDIEIRPVWQLTDEEERRTHEILASYRLPESVTDSVKLDSSAIVKPPRTTSTGNPLTRLLDSPDLSPIGWLGMGLTTFFLGAIHSLQPGHGKTLSFAGTTGAQHPWRSALILGTATTMAHMSTVFALAVGLLISNVSDYAALQAPLIRTAGFGIAATGFWRLGRELRGNQPQPRDRTLARGDRGLLALGLAAGLVPCWEAIGLMTIAASIGKTLLGIYLVACFSVGMGVVLIAVAGLISQFGQKVGTRWTRAAGLIRFTGSLVLVGLGIWFLAR